MYAAIYVVLLLGIVNFNDAAMAGEDPIETISKALPPYVPYKHLLTDTVLTITASYLSDNPTTEQPDIGPGDIEPFTPAGLFKTYYGKQASSVNYEQAILDLVYAEPSTSLAKEDRISMRRNLYLYAQAGSFDLARSTMGKLLLHVMGDFANNDAAWFSNRTLPTLHYELAVSAVQVEFAKLRNEVGESKFGQYLDIGAGATLTFVIDDTGSMSGEIKAATKRAKSILSHVQNSLDRPKEFVLVPFNDPDVGPVTVTTDPKHFKVALDKLSAHGGGDLPELCLRGIQLGVENSRPGSTVYVITDAQAKDVTIQDSVIAQASQKNVKVVFMLTNRLSHCPTGPSKLLHCYDLYEHIANVTGGKIVVVNKQEIFRATHIVQTGIKQGMVTLKKVKILQESDVTINYPVDHRVTQVVIEAQGSCNTLVPKTNVTKVRRIGNLQSETVTVRNNSGEWTSEMRGPHEVRCDVTVQGRSTMGFVLTMMAKQIGEPRDQYRVLDGLPSPGMSLAFFVDGYGLQTLGNAKDYVTALRFVDAYGNDVMESIKVDSDLSLVDDTLKHYMESGIAGFSPFYVAVEGQDTEGVAFSRVISRLITSSSVEMTCNLDDVIFIPGIPTTANITVRNNIENDTFTFRVSDTKDFASTRGPTSVEIGQGESHVFSIRLNAPDKTKDGTASKVTFTVKGRNTDSLQYSVCTIAVGQKKRPRVDSLNIAATINSRFAETVVTSLVKNNAHVGREAEFQMILPRDAFIVGLTMTLANETIVGEVVEKKKAKKIYDEAKKTGKAAGHVASRDQSTRVYKTSLFLEAHGHVTFRLTYQELLHRVRGRYQYQVAIQPDQPVKRLQLDVYINEESSLTFVEVLPFKTEQVNLVESEQSAPPGTNITISSSRHSSHVRFSPSITEQTEFSPLGMAGAFTVEYDVDRLQHFGQITMAGGYFAHFIAPPSLPLLPKLVVFAIDISGSMFGHKMAQLRQAMTQALNGLKSNDYFNLVLFGNTAEAWVPQIMVPATRASINNAIEFLNETEPQGGTNVWSAFETSFNILAPYLPIAGYVPQVKPYYIYKPEEKQKRRFRKRAAESIFDLPNYSKIMVFLTDGRPSVGETNPTLLAENIEHLNRGRVNIHTLGFGSLVDMKFLTKMAAQNGGESRRIFESLDAATQIANYLQEVSSPVMTDVSILYPPDMVADVIGSSMSVYSAGQEIVVSGRVLQGVWEDDEMKKDEFDDVDLIDGSGVDGRELRYPRSIHGQVRGRSDGADLELDFDISTEDLAVTQINRHEHVIANFTERLWAFLRIKDLLKQAAITDDETLQNSLKEQALNDSLRYHFVSPLASLLVIRPEDRRRIEDKLKREEEKLRIKAAEEEKKRLEEERKREEEAKLEKKPDLYTPEHSVSVVYDAPARHYSRGRDRGGGGGGGGGFSGDPHFLIAISDDVNLCFNWNGDEGEIHNLLFDENTKATVNGKMATSSAPENEKLSYRTYISQLSVLLPAKNFQLIINPTNIVFIPPYGEPYTIPVTSDFRYSKSNLTVYVYDVRTHVAKIYIAFDKVEYHIILHKELRHIHQVDHIDFSAIQNDDKVENENNNHLDGVIGQFLNKDFLNLKGDMEDEGIFIFGDRVGKVTKQIKKNPVSSEKVPCWYSHGNAKSLMRGNNNRYLLKSMLDLPEY